MTKSLRVLALVTDASGGRGGIAQYNQDFLRSLAACGLIGEVVVLSRLDWASLNQLPFAVRQLRPARGKMAYSLAALRAALTMPIDIVFCGHLFMAPLAAAIAKLIRSPLWLQVHGIEAWQERSGVHRRSVESAALVSAVSRYTRRRLLEWAAIDPARVKVLPNTVDPRFRPQPKLARLLDRYQMWGKKVLVTVSRLASSERYKGHDRVIRVLPRVIAEHPQTRYLIVGDGDDRPRLEALATEVGVREHVHFTGFVAPGDLPDHYRLGDVFVMPSTGEGFGIAFLEAMACGIRVVGGNRDGSVDPLGDGALGTTVDPQDADELATAICVALTAAPAQVDRAGRFDVRAFGEQLEALVSSHFVVRQ